MWDERKMPERWYGLLRKRMQVEEQRMRVIRDGGIHDKQEDLLAHANSLDREMLSVMRQAIAGAIEANNSTTSPHARSAEWRAGLSRFFPSEFA